LRSESAAICTKVKSFSIYVTSLLFVIDAHAVARDFPWGKVRVERL
jgi:hypothetical protein